MEERLHAELNLRRGQASSLVGIFSEKLYTAGDRFVRLLRLAPCTIMQSTDIVATALSARAIVAKVRMCNKCVLMTN